jgi:hypothetical protein
MAEEARLAEERAALLVRWEEDLKAALARTRQKQEQQRVALARDEQLRREALARRAAGFRATRAAGERREMAQRALECRLRMERGARARAEQRAFEARRDETSRLAQARQGASRRDRRGEPPAMRER